MALLEVADLRALWTTTLSDDALQMLLDANEAAINAVAGTLGTEIVEYHFTPYYESVITLKHVPAVTDSPLGPVVVEGWGLSQPVTLADDDYVVDGSVIYRLDGGTNPGIYFEKPTRVAYYLPDNTDERIRVLLGLIKLDATHRPGLRAFTVGKHREEFGSATDGSDYLASREALLASLRGALPVFD